MKRTTIITLAVAISIAVAGLATAQACDLKPKEGACCGQKQMWSKLGLSKDQQKRMHEVVKENGGKEDFEAVRAEEDALRKLVHSGAADEQTVRAQAAKIAAIKEDAAVRQAKVFQQIRAILTPDQIRIFEDRELRTSEGRGCHMRSGKDCGCSGKDHCAQCCDCCNKHPKKHRKKSGHVCAGCEGLPGEDHGMMHHDDLE